MPPYRVQDPTEVLDWNCDFTTELDAVGSPSDTLDDSSKSITVEGDDGGSPSIVTSTELVSLGVYSVLVSNLQWGVTYRIRFKIDTTQGRTLTRSITVRCEFR